MKKLIRGTGNWVSGERFWNRDREMASFAQYLKDGANILIVAPRRIGKTSLIREAQRRFGNEYAFLVTDLEACRTAEEMIVTLATSCREETGLWHRTKEAFRGILGGAELSADQISLSLKDAVAGAWKEKGTRLLDELAKSEKAVVLCFDEYPLLVGKLLKDRNGDITDEGLKAADELVSWLRAMSTHHRGKIRFVLCGSIGLEPVLREAGLSGSITTFTPFYLEPWDTPTAAGCLRALAAQYQLSLGDGVAIHMVNRLGSAIPHHVQLYFDLLYEECRRTNTVEVTPRLADRVYTERMLSSRGHPELSALEERLKLALGNRKMALAIDLLTEAAVSGRLTADAAIALWEDQRQRNATNPGVVQDVLLILEHDGYLVKRDDDYVFLSQLLHDWWKARFSFGFKPASQRGERTNG